MYLAALQAVDSDGFGTQEFVTWASIAFTITLLGISLWHGMRRTRLRPILDVGRLIAQSAAAIAVPILTTVVTSPVLILGALAVGIALGLAQAQRLDLEIRGNRIYAKRNAVGFAIWAVGLVMTQAAGAVNRAGVLRLGQAVTWLAIGLLLGLILGRYSKTDQAVRAMAGGAIPALVLVLLVLASCGMVLVVDFEAQTTISSDESIEFQISLGGPVEDATPEDIEEFRQACQEAQPGLLGLPADGYIRFLERDGYAWCAFGLNFPDLETFRDGFIETMLALGNNEAPAEEVDPAFSIRCLASNDGRVSYDFLLRTPGDGDDGESTGKTTWRVTIPGEITRHNADAVQGNTAIWNLVGGSSEFRFHVNLDAQDRCPSGELRLDLEANSDGSGLAKLSGPLLGTPRANIERFAAELTTAGWPTIAPQPGQAPVTERSWTTPEDFATIVGSLPPLAGSTFTMTGSDDGEQLSFDGQLSVTSYGTYWSGINPTIAPPPLTLTYQGPGPVVSTTGQWASSAPPTFNWKPDSGGSTFPLGVVSATDPNAGAGGLGTPEPSAEAGSAETGDQPGDATVTDSDGSAETGDQPGDTTVTGSTETGASDEDEGQVADSETITGDEALANAIAGLIAAVAMGVITWAEAQEALGITDGTSVPAPAAPEAQPDTAPPQAQPDTAPLPPQSDTAPPQLDPAETTYLLALWQQADGALTEDGGKRLNFFGLQGNIDAIRDRAQAGTATMQDIDILRRIRNLAYSSNAALRAGDNVWIANQNRFLEAAESLFTDIQDGAKISAGLLGSPVQAAIVSTVVDTVALRDSGIDKAALTAASNTIISTLTGGLAERIGGRGLLQATGIGSLENGVSASLANYMEQYIAHDGDESKINMDAVWAAGERGLATGLFKGAGDYGMPEAGS